MSPQNQYMEFLNHLPTTTSDQSLIVLKGHLLVEQALRSFIGRRVPRPERIEDNQLSFAVLVDFASCLDNGDSLEWVWQASKNLNKLRNLLAHNLSHNKAKESEEKFISHVRENYGDLSIAIDGCQLKYEELPLAILKIYDSIVQYPYMHPADLARLEHRLAKSFEEAFSSIEHETK